MVMYDKVVKYKIYAECSEPMHIGNGDGDQCSILLHPVENVPFIQATSLAGVFRSYYNTDQHTQEQMFGASKTKKAKEDTIFGSRIKFSDAYFDNSNLKIELRPHVKINGESGTCDQAQNAGTTKTSGQKFEMEYLAAGSSFAFTIYIFEVAEKENFEPNLEECLANIQNGNLQFGGKKSIGCGYLNFMKIEKKVFDLKERADRDLWKEEENLTTKDYKNITETIKTMAKQQQEYLLELSGKTEGALLIRGICSQKNFGKDDKSSDAENMRNAKGDYIIPGSSLKGMIRSQVESIAAYKNISKDVIEFMFGKSLDGENGGMIGTVGFCDTVIGSQKENESVDPQRRIHIDKFTGGVFMGGLFDEKPAYGDVKFTICVKNTGDKKDQQACALLLMALRDLAVGAVSTGSGNSIGRGYIETEKITYQSATGETAVLNMKERRYETGKDIVEACMKTLQEG